MMSACYTCLRLLQVETVHLYNTLTRRLEPFVPADPDRVSAELAAALDVKMSGIGTMLNRAEEEFRNRYLALHSNLEEL